MSYLPDLLKGQNLPGENHKEDNSIIYSNIKQSEMFLLQQCKYVFRKCTFMIRILITVN